MLRKLRHREKEFNNTLLEEVIQKAKARGKKHPAVLGFDYDEKKGVLYRLLLPRLDEVLSNELAQTGDEDGVELVRQVVRKLDPPKGDVAFDLKAEIEGLGKHVCTSFQPIARFFAMLDTRV